MVATNLEMDWGIHDPQQHFFWLIRVDEYFGFKLKNLLSAIGTVAGSGVVLCYYTVDFQCFTAIRPFDVVGRSATPNCFYPDAAIGDAHAGYQFGMPKIFWLKFLVPFCFASNVRDSKIHLLNQKYPTTQ